MRLAIDPSALSRSELIAARSESAYAAEQCEIAAALARGRRKGQLTQWARIHMRNAIAADNALSGAPDCGAMTADELLAELLA